MVQPRRRSLSGEPAGRAMATVQPEVSRQANLVRNRSASPQELWAGLRQPPSCVHAHYVTLLQMSRA